MAETLKDPTLEAMEAPSSVELPEKKNPLDRLADGVSNIQETVKGMLPGKEKKEESDEEPTKGKEHSHDLPPKESQPASRVRPLSWVRDVTPKESRCHKQFFRGKSQASSRELARTILEEYQSLTEIKNNAEKLRSFLDTFAGDVVISSAPQVMSLVAKLFQAKDKGEMKAIAQEMSLEQLQDGGKDKKVPLWQRLVANYGSSAAQFMYYNDALAKAAIEPSHKKTLRKKIFWNKFIDGTLGIIPGIGFILDYFFKSNERVERLMKRELRASEKDLRHFGLDVAEVQAAVEAGDMKKVEDELEARIAHEVLVKRHGRQGVKAAMEGAQMAVDGVITPDNVDQMPVSGRDDLNKPVAKAA